MSTQKNICERCGAEYTRGARFCPKCGAPLVPSSPGGAGGFESASGVVNKVSSMISKVQSTVNSAGSIAKTAENLSTITIRPPAEWKVVVGEVIPVAGQKAVEAAVSTAEKKVVGEVSRVVTEHLSGAAKTPPQESVVPRQASPSSPEGLPCPSCGIPVVPGKKFCGSCGAKMEGDAKPTAVPPTQPVCPACGKAVIPGKKFCGTCGHKLH